MFVGIAHRRLTRRVHRK